MQKKVLLTGATGYIGKRLLPSLIDKGYTVVCAVRDPARFSAPESLLDHIEIIQLDLLDKATLKNIPTDIEAAYYLIHSMSSSKDYKKLEEECANNFVEGVKNTAIQHTIYLSGMVNDDNLSEHLSSRLNVEEILSKGDYHFTALRAGIIIGSGSASFEIIRDLVEKLPVMIAPKWVKTKCQPIGITDVITFLTRTLFNEETYEQNFDIAGPDILTYKEMLLQFAKIRKLNRSIFVVPVMTPRLSSHWLYFVTSTSFKLAQSLVDSMTVEVVARDEKINEILGVQPISYHEAIKRAFQKIKNNDIVSSWKDASSSSGFASTVSDFIEVPEYGCFIDQRSEKYDHREKCIDRIWSIGGKTGWYYGNWLWKIRGYMDKLVGGVGLRRGRTSVHTIHAGDSLDFWRVIYADRSEGRLLMFAEMKLPGEAWLEFRIKDDKLVQTATFRPVGILGRLYWYSVLPFHGFIFSGMLNKLAKG